MKRLSVWSALVALGLHAQAQVVVNEACSKNVRAAADGNDYPDWIELHNTGLSSAALGGLYLSDDALEPLKWPLPSITLPAGGYLLLFEGNENDGTHFTFKLSQEGENILLSDAQGIQQDALLLPYLRADHSFGRTVDGLRYFTQPTPGSANLTTAYLGYAVAPTFNKTPGFHTAAVEVNVSTEAGLIVRHTRDGREPNETSDPVSGTVTVDATGVVKAKAWGDQLIPSTTTVATYLINEATRLPTISLTTHPDSLFDDTLGLYMLGPEADSVYPFWGANFWDERGITVRFEYFEEDGDRMIDQDVELRIHGGRASRTKPQRPLRLTARDELGDDLIHYPFFPERPGVDEFKRIILRNSGADWCLAHYRDGLFHQISLHNDLDIDELGFKPTIVFLNGQYWGIHELRERIDEDHLALDYGADRDDLLLMEEENWSIQGDTIHFHELKEFIHTHDLNDEAHWAHVDSLLDVRSFMDYFALEMWAGNADWPSNNLKYWKPSVAEGKWRYMLYDMDATMSVVGWIPNDFDMFFWVLDHRAGFVHAEIYRSLMTRTEFKRGFLNRLADLMNTTLSTEAVLRENERIRNTIGEEVPRHYARWGFDPATWAEHSGELIPSFVAERPDIMRQDVLERYQLPNTAALDFAVFPPEAGTVRINTITPDMPFTGVYFNGNDIDVTATAAEGYVFDRWTYADQSGTTHTDPHWRASFPVDGALTALFRKPGSELVAFPNPMAGEVTLSLVAGSGGGALAVLTDAIGRKVWERQWTVSEGVNQLSFSALNLISGTYNLEVHLAEAVHRTRLMK